MENQILTLNAVAGDDGVMESIENSLLSTEHGRLQRALQPGVRVELIPAPQSGTLRVAVVSADDKIESLSLSVWKDATIQFKLSV